MCICVLYVCTLSSLLQSRGVCCVRVFSMYSVTEYRGVYMYCTCVLCVYTVYVMLNVGTVCVRSICVLYDRVEGRMCVLHVCSLCNLSQSRGVYVCAVCVYSMCVCCVLWYRVEGLCVYSFLVAHADQAGH